MQLATQLIEKVQELLDMFLLLLSQNRKWERTPSQDLFWWSWNAYLVIQSLRKIILVDWGTTLTYHWIDPTLSENNKQRIYIGYWTLLRRYCFYLQSLSQHAVFAPKLLPNFPNKFIWLGLKHHNYRNHSLNAKGCPTLVNVCITWDAVSDSDSLDLRGDPRICIFLKHPQWIW